jgi:hypothetical protein
VTESELGDEAIRVLRRAQARAPLSAEELAGVEAEIDAIAQKSERPAHVRSLVAEPLAWLRAAPRAR